MLGLNHNSIQRLKSLWELVSDKAREQWRQMDILMSPQHNFRHYRRELKQRKQPVLPYFGIYLRDFTFINDGNEKYNPDGTSIPAVYQIFQKELNDAKFAGSINDKYVNLLYERVKEVQRFQSVPYNLGNLGRSPAIQDYLTAIQSQVILDEVICLFSVPSVSMTHWDCDE